MQFVRTKTFTQNCWRLNRWKYGKSRDESCRWNQSLNLWVNSAFANILTSRGLPACPKNASIWRIPPCHHVTMSPTISQQKDSNGANEEISGFRPCSSHRSTSLSRKKLTSWPERKLHLVVSLSCRAVIYGAPFRNGQKSSCTSQSVWMVGWRCNECLVCISFTCFSVRIGLHLRISKEPLVCWQTPDSWTGSVACREVDMKCTGVNQYYRTVLLWLRGM